MLSVIMLNVIMPSVIMLSVIMLSVIMLTIIMLSIVMLSVIILNVNMLRVTLLCHYAECYYAECRGALFAGPTKDLNRERLRLCHRVTMNRKSSNDHDDVKKTIFEEKKLAADVFFSSPGLCTIKHFAAVNCCRPVIS